MTRILCLWFPNWPLERLVHARSELKGRAVILFRHVRRGRRVAACSAAAAREGVVSDMPLAEATALAQAAHVAAFDPAADRAALEHLAVECAQFSPLVGLEESELPECLLLRIDGTAPLWGGEESLAGEVADAFCDHGWRVRMAVADTIGAAWALARFGPARSATPQHVPPGRAMKTLAPLPIAALRLPSETLALLVHLGVQTIAQLMALERADLAVRFGPIVALRLDQALGDAVETIAAHCPPPEFEVGQTFEYPIEQRAAIEHVLAELVEQLAAQLAIHGRGAMQLECAIDCQAQRGLRLPVATFRPLADARHLLELLALQFERLVLPGPVAAVRLSVLTTAPVARRQQELFVDARERNGPHELGRLVDRLSSRLGREAVVRPLLVADAQPEYACRFEPLTGDPGRLPARQRTAQRRPPSNECPWRRALQLEPRPIPLAVRRTLAGGPPEHFRWRGHEEQVVRAWGPERIFTGWWRRRTIRRDYYRVETSTGHRLWLFRRLEDNRWFVHGRFD